MRHGEALRAAAARLHTSIPVVIETFTFLERNANRDVALAWKESIYRPRAVKILTTSFAIMQRARIRLAYAFDHHFAVAGFRLVA